MQTHTTNDAHIPAPVFIRLPRYGQKCPHTGLSRSGLALLTRPQPANNFRPPVKSRLMRQTGTSGRTIRLIDFNTLVRHLNSLPDGVERDENAIARTPRALES